MNSAYYEIAGLTLQVTGDNAQLTELSGFRPFRVEVPSHEPIANLVLNATLEGYNFDDAEWIFTSGEDGVCYEFGRHATGFCYRSTSKCDEPFLLWYDRISGSLECNAECCEGYQPYELRFLLWVAFSLVALPYNAVPIHTSVIMNGGKAYMFLGESGTGKSTHTRLWRQHIEGSELLNDDSPYLRIENGQAFVYGSPWSGKTPCYKPLRVPLGGVTRLSQAPYNKMRRLSKLEAMGALLPSCPPNFAYDDGLTDMICEIIGAVIKSTPVFHLECLPDEAAAQLSYHNLTESER